MFILIVIIAIIVIYLYYKKHKQAPQDNNYQYTDNTHNNSSEQLTAYDSVSDQSQNINTNIINNNVEISDIKTEDNESIQVQTQDIENNKNSEDNSELLIAVKEKINSQFIEPKKPEVLQLEVSVSELKILHYLSHMFEKENPLPNYLGRYYDTYENLLANGYFTEATPEVFLEQKCKVDDLKSYLRANNLPVSGNKANLIKRIVENINIDKLKIDFDLEGYNILSDKGIEAIKKYPKNILNKLEFINMVEAVYNNLNKNILLNNLDFAAENIKFLDQYKEYDLPIKAFILVYDKIASLTFNKGTNPYFDSYTKIFEELYGITIPYNVFMQIENYYHSFKELKRDKDNRLYPTYKIQTMEDARTCTFCKKMSNKEFSYSDAKIGINYPPFYDCKCDFCRCYAESIFDESVLED